MYLWCKFQHQTILIAVFFTRQRKIRISVTIYLIPFLKKLKIHNIKKVDDLACWARKGDVVVNDKWMLNLKDIFIPGTIKYFLSLGMKFFLSNC